MTWTLNGCYQLNSAGQFTAVSVIEKHRARGVKLFRKNQLFSLISTSHLLIRGIQIHEGFIDG